MNEYECPGLNDSFSFSIEKVVKNIRGFKTFVFDEFVYGGHLLSIGTSLIALTTMILLSISIRWEFLFIIYLGTQCMYNYDHYKEIDVNNSENRARTRHLLKYGKMLPVLLAFYGIGYFVLLSFFGNIESIIFGSILLSCGLLYTYNFKNMTEKIVGFKSLYTAGSWGLLVVFTAIYCLYPVFSLLLFVIVLFVFLRWFVNTSFCDLKDIEADKKENLLTLPIYFGRDRFIKILHVINFLAFAILLAAIYYGIAPMFTLFLFVFYLYGFYYINKARNPGTDLHSLSNIVVDGELLAVGSYFFTLI